MRHGLRRKTAIAATALFASAALLAGCASSGDSGSDNSSSGSTGSTSGLIATKAGIIGDQQDAGDPVSGGTLRFSGMLLPPFLDPADPRAQAAGSTGGTEEINIYGSLMRYDPESDSFVPQMAKDLKVSDDNLTWTLALRDGVEFSDGSPMDAQAVADSINRFTDVKGPTSNVFIEAVDTVEATDPTTVVFHMKAPWNELPAALSYGYGMIIAPAGYADPNNFKPIGAGPFTVGEFVPSTSLTLEANPDYWDGEPYLDGVHFQSLTPGATQVQALQAGELDVLYVRDSRALTEAAGDVSGYYEPLSLNDVLLINDREGHPGANPNVRKAIAAAINPEVISQQAFAGTTEPTTEIFPSWSKWHTGVPGYDYDPAQARQYLEQAKADGYDGTITYLAMNAGTSRKIAQATESMLTDVGFNVDMQYAQQSDILKKLYVDHAFDITYSSFSVGDASPMLRIYDALYSTSPNNVTGFASPEMDKVLTAANQATGESNIKDAMHAVEQQIHDDIPFVSIGAGANFVGWKDNVHGVLPSSDAIVLFSKTWLSN